MFEGLNENKDEQMILVVNYANVRSSIGIDGQIRLFDVKITRSEVWLVSRSEKIRKSSCKCLKVH